MTQELRSMEMDRIYFGTTVPAPFPVPGTETVLQVGREADRAARRLHDAARQGLRRIAALTRPASK